MSEYQHGMMRAGDGSPRTAGLWKYWNSVTNRIEFHPTEQTTTHLRLIRPPVLAQRERFGEDHED